MTSAGSGLTSARRRNLLDFIAIRNMARPLQIVTRGTWDGCSPGNRYTRLAKANPLKGGDAKLPV